MSTRADSQPLPGLRRVRRLKLLTAILLLALFLMCLVLFSLGVADADAGFERNRVDRLLRRQVAAAGEQVSIAGGNVVVAMAGDEGFLGGYPQVYVVALGDGRGAEHDVLFAPATPWWPNAPIVDVAMTAARLPPTAEPRIVGGMARRIAPSNEMQDLRLLAMPVVDDDGEARAVIVGVATISSGEARHTRLVRYMQGLGAGVVLLGIVVAVLMARGRFWLVDKALLRHEQFLHDTAHELRSPLGTLRTITEAGLAGDLPPRQALERAAHVVESTDQVIDDLMTLTRIEIGRELLEVEPLRLDLLVETLVEQRTDEPPIVVETQPTVIDANAELVRRAIENLVENAVRHGRADNPAAEVTVSVTEGRVTVVDRGAGLAPQILTHVLERTSGNGRRRGLGLGLAIASWVARVHGFRLEASNRPDGGASFSLQFKERSGHDRVTAGQPR